MAPEFNLLAISLMILLLLLWKLDFIATILTLKHLRPELPEEFKGVWDAEKYAKSQNYEKVQSRFGITSSITSLTVLIVFWIMGGFGWLDELVRSWEYGEITTGICFFALMFAGTWLMSVPFEIYHTFVIEERFGFNKVTPKLFITDQVKSLGLTACLGIPILALLLWIFNNVDHAWFFAWISLTLISLALTYIAPSVFLPIFNKFEPLEDGELNQAIQAMAEKCQYPLSGVFVMDGSKRSTKSNAFFVGFGKRKKIALYDTLIEGQSTKELVAVLAHEIGHFKKKHIVKLHAILVIKMAIIFYLLGLATDPDTAFGSQLYAAFGVSSGAIYVGLVLFMIVFKPVSRVLSVFMNILSRKHEFEADAYAANVQDTSEHLITALKKLSVNNLSNLTPHPLEIFLHASHPPLLTRINALKAL